MAHKLYLVPNFIGEFAPEYLPERTITLVHSLKHFVVEKEKTARAFLKAIGHPTPQSEFQFAELNKHDGYQGFRNFFNKHIGQYSIGLLSEAGLPAIADPGSEVVMYAHQQGVTVDPLAGSSSIFLALMASGMDGQQFAFNGYLPIDKAQRIKKLKQIEANARYGSQIFMEAPYRNNDFLKFLLQNLQSTTKLCVAANLETQRQRIVSKQVKDWKPGEIDLHKQPVMFIIGA